MLVHFILIVTTILTLTGFFGQFGFWFDLTAHFRFQYLTLQLLCALFFIYKKQWKFLSLAIVACFINLALILPFYFSKPPAQESNGKTLSIMLINVYSANTQYDKVIAYVQQMKPDILALEEINDHWINGLDTLLKTYPYQQFQSRTDNFGIGLYSKLPTKDMQIVYYGSAQVPNILMNLILNNKPYTLLFTHPLPPINTDYFNWRNSQLQDISTQRKEFSENFILIGDLNTTSWSYYFQKLIKETGLMDTRQGFGLQTSWPTLLPIMGVTIDHILVSKNIQVLDRKIGPDIGSDHYPVFIKLGIN